MSRKKICFLKNILSFIFRYVYCASILGTHECRHWWKSTQDISSSGYGVIDSGNPSDTGAQSRIWVFYKNSICSYPLGHLSSSAKVRILTNLVSMSK